MFKKMNRIAKSCLSLILATALTIGFSIPANAADQYVKKTVCITKAGQVVDTFNGVAAKYTTASSNTGTYCCARYVSNYYSAVFDVAVSDMFTGHTPDANYGDFKKLTIGSDTVLPGDIGYQTNSSGSGHWFIIKAVNTDGSFTVIEQNWKYTSGGKVYATVNRRVSKSTSGIKIFRYRPESVALSGLKASSGCFTAGWNTKKGITGYQIMYSTSKDFSTSTKVRITSSTTSSKKITGLTSGKTYYVKIRSYKTVDGTNYVSAWSSVQTVKVK